jgi:hypothetical protein
LVLGLLLDVFLRSSEQEPDDGKYGRDDQKL